VNAATAGTPPDRPRLGPGVVAALGTPSLLMGIGPLLAPRAVTRLIGLEPRPAVVGLVRLVGLRELVVAVLFVGRRSPRWLAGFLAQDAVDLMTAAWLLGTGRPRSPSRFRRACAVYALIAAVDVGVSRRHLR
jgi:hypothetical protein